ncbi:MAG: hypothetical protein QGH62_03540 [Nitrospinaceae bacterium]|nr:hypothetical protein [Nitrospinaceae bacterium]
MIANSAKVNGITDDDGVDPVMEPYARLKGRLRFTASDSALRLHIKRPHAYRPVPHLDPALRARLQSALQRPDLKPTTRAKIEAVLGRKNEPQETLCPK